MQTTHGCTVYKKTTDNVTLPESKLGSKYSCYYCFSYKVIGQTRTSIEKGHDDTEGYFRQLLQIRAEDLPDLNTFLKCFTTFTSPEIQTEIFNMLLSGAVLKLLIGKVKNAVAIGRQVLQQCHILIHYMDGTEDVLRKGVYISLRYVEDNFNIEECFIGLYQPADTIGESLSLLLQNVLTKSDLSLDNFVDKVMMEHQTCLVATMVAKSISQEFNL